MAIVRIQLRRDTATDWTSANPVLAAGELGVETDTDQFKIGDGSTVWASLAYGGIVGPAGTNGTNGADGADGADSVAAATSPLAYNAGTQTISIDLSSYDTSSEVDAKVAAIVDSAPATLDTLNELAAALGDDANFATTVTNSLAAKALLTQTINAKTANYTLVVGDRGAFVTCSGTFTITLPSATFSAGDRVDFVNIGTGVITFTGSGVTVNSVEAAVTIDTQWAGATFFFTSASAGVLVGKLA
jgi:hypothetical protein